MSVTDADQLAEVAWRTVETDPTFTSGLWTVPEIANYFNQRQSRFNRDTKLMLAHLPIFFAAGQESADLPADWIATLNGTWTPVGGTASPVAAGDRFAAETGMSLTHNLPNRPVLMDDQNGGARTVELYPVPDVPGALELLYASVLSVLNFGLVPDTFDIPDDFVPYVTYGVLCDMLSKEGRGRDLARAQYCESRYQEGVGLAAVLLEGYF